jgi:hypothetical protein
MTVRLLRTLDQLFTRDDGRISPDEAGQLVDASRDHGTVAADERAELETVATAPRTTLAARNVIETFLAQPAPTVAPPLTSITGYDPSQFGDDRLVLGPDGSARGSSSVTPYSRSYAAVKEGPMLHAHGSKAPHSSILTDEENAHALAQKPAAALDAMAKARGVSLPSGFVALANAKTSFDPTAPFWWGKCHAWAWAALSTELSARVDVGGPEGQRGLWLSGQWLSRADLGNFLMGVADTIAIADENVLFEQPVTPMDLLHASAQFLLEGGGGLVADIHNDDAHGGDREVWNQPFIAADVDTRTLSGEGAAAVLALARQDGKQGTTVKHVHLVGRYGNERSNDWEGAPGLASKSWNVYAVTDAAGTVIAAYAADDARLEGAPGLPTRASHELPEYLWKPSLQNVEDALSGTPNRNIDADTLSREYRFFVSTVLARGVPGVMRARFEADVASLQGGRLNAPSVARLLRDYPGVSEAYSEAQWERAFGSRGLSRVAFGAGGSANEI